jgi:hypothetical protein
MVFNNRKLANTVYMFCYCKKVLYEGYSYTSVNAVQVSVPEGTFIQFCILGTKNKF